MASSSSSSSSKQTPAATEKDDQRTPQGAPAGSAAAAAASAAPSTAPAQVGLSPASHKSSGPSSGSKKVEHEDVKIEQEIEQKKLKLEDAINKKWTELEALGKQLESADSKDQGTATQKFFIVINEIKKLQHELVHLEFHYPRFYADEDKKTDSSASSQRDVERDVVWHLMEGQPQLLELKISLLGKQLKKQEPAMEKGFLDASKAIINFDKPVDNKSVSAVIPYFSGNQGGENFSMFVSRAKITFKAALLDVTSRSVAAGAVLLNSAVNKVSWQVSTDAEISEVLKDIDALNRKYKSFPGMEEWTLMIKQKAMRNLEDGNVHLVVIPRMQTSINKISQLINALVESIDKYVCDPKKPNTIREKSLTTSQQTWDYAVDLKRMVDDVKARLNRNLASLTQGYGVINIEPMMESIHQRLFNMMVVESKQLNVGPNSRFVPVMKHMGEEFWPAFMLEYQNFFKLLRGGLVSTIHKSSERDEQYIRIASALLNPKSVEDGKLASNPHRQFSSSSPPKSSASGGVASAELIVRPSAKQALKKKNS